jgi:hypothetical protein
VAVHPLEASKESEENSQEECEEESSEVSEGGSEEESEEESEGSAKKPKPPKIKGSPGLTEAVAMPADMFFGLQRLWMRDYGWWSVAGGFLVALWLMHRVFKARFGQFERFRMCYVPGTNKRKDADAGWPEPEVVWKATTSSVVINDLVAWTMRDAFPAGVDPSRPVLRALLPGAAMWYAWASLFGLKEDFNIFCASKVSDADLFPNELEDKYMFGCGVKMDVEWTLLTGVQTADVASSPVGAVIVGAEQTDQTPKQAATSSARAKSPCQEGPYCLSPCPQSLRYLTTIGASAFAFSHIVSLEISGLPQLTTIGKNFCSGAPLLKTVVLRNLKALTSFGTGAFRGCEELQCTVEDIPSLGGLIGLAPFAFALDIDTAQTKTLKKKK